MAASFKHLVVLMMENRSFDHILGFLPGVNGLTGNETNPLTPEGPLVQVSQDARTVHDLIPDPGHEFINVNMQIFGNQAGTDDGQPKMQGFVRDYALVSNDSAQGANIMKCFTPTTVPVLSALAQAYAVSDSWYSSVPGSTIPNRLFAHGATSNGSLTQDVIEAPATLQTIFEAMDEPGNPYTYRIYTNGSTVLMANLYLMQRQNAFRSYSDFANDCTNGDLPAYTFIEPSYDDNLAAGTYATSQHPDFPVDEGEGFIADVYNALTGSPGWKDTLLLIVYDEHGGIFDHVMPPNVAPSAANAALPDVQHSVNPSFDFRRLGVRVPAVFVSPRISANRVINGQNFEHSSIVATVRKLFCTTQTPFNWREAQAPMWSREAYRGPYLVTSALMALEAWAHVRVERGEAVDSILSDIVGEEGAPAAYLLPAVDVILSHWPESKSAAVPFLGSPELLAMDRSRFAADSMPEFPDILGLKAISKEPLGHVKAEDLKKRPSRKWMLDQGLGQYAGAESNSDLHKLLTEASARLGQPNDTHNFRDPEFMAVHALNMIDPNNWR